MKPLCSSCAIRAGKLCTVSTHLCIDQMYMRTLGGGTFRLDESRVARRRNPYMRHDIPSSEETAKLLVAIGRSRYFAERHIVEYVVGGKGCLHGAHPVYFEMLVNIGRLL